MKTVKYFIIVLLFAFSTKSLCQDQSIYVFDPTAVSTSFQYTLSRLTEDSVFIVDSLDDSIYNYDAAFLFLRYPYIMSQVDESIIINYTALKKPAYIFSQIAPDTNSNAFYNHIGLVEMLWLLVSLPIDSVIGVDNFFTEDIVIDTTFMSGAVPVVFGELDSILIGPSITIDVNTTYISTIDTLQVILDLYNLIDDEGFLRRVLEYFDLIQQPQNVDIQFYPTVDTALVNGGCTTPEFFCKNLLSTNVRDSISIEPGFNTYFYYFDSSVTQIPLDNFYFLVIDSLDEFNYELWYHPKSYPPFDPILVEFDSTFFSEQNKFSLQLVVKKNGLKIDSLSQFFHADFGMLVDDSGIIPNEFSLSQNYPNPFNPVTNIQYAVSSRQFVTLIVYDVLGNEIATLVNEEKQPGIYEVEFNTSSIKQLPSSGIYFYQLKAGDYTQTRKMILLK